MQQLSQFQRRARDDKLFEIERRQTQLKKDKSVDITPPNGGSFPWSQPGVDLAEFEQKMSMMPVRVRGIFDHSKEIMVNKVRKGEKGADVVTPFYTHLDKNKRPCAILVNRGWVPYDLLHQRMHQKQSTGVLYGILYPGDAKNKWSLPNSPTIEDFNIVTPADFALIDQLPNEAEAAKMMMHIIDFDPETRQLLPTVPTVEELTKYHISPERHQAWEQLWKMASFAGVLANTALWIYF